MTVFQIVNGVSYLNGIRTEVDKIAVSDIEESLATLTIEIENKKQAVQKLLTQRDEVIVHAYKHGFSAIQLGKLLNLTRQRIYDVLKNYGVERNTVVFQGQELEEE